MLKSTRFVHLLCREEPHNIIVRVYRLLTLRNTGHLVIPVVCSSPEESRRVVPLRVVSWLGARQANSFLLPCRLRSLPPPQMLLLNAPPHPPPHPPPHTMSFKSLSSHHLLLEASNYTFESGLEATWVSEPREQHPHSLHMGLSSY